jgi:hypothetical protein
VGVLKTGNGGDVPISGGRSSRAFLGDLAQDGAISPAIRSQRDESQSCRRYIVWGRTGTFGNEHCTIGEKWLGFDIGYGIFGDAGGHSKVTLAWPDSLTTAMRAFSETTILTVT